MKKRAIIFTLLALICFSSCSTQQKSNTAEDKSQSHVISDNYQSASTLKMLEDGVSPIRGYYNASEKGMYFTQWREDASTNIKYLDFATKTEMYLCNRLECEHKDESCTSWRAYANNTVYAYEVSGKLYIQHSGSASDGTGNDFYAAYGKLALSRIEECDLNGQNNKTLIELPANISFVGRPVIDDLHIYSMTKSVENKDNILIEKYRIAKININTKSIEYMKDFSQNNPEIIGVYGRNFVIQAINVSEVLSDTKFIYYYINCDTKDITPAFNDVSLQFRNLKTMNSFAYAVSSTDINQIEMETGKVTSVFHLSSIENAKDFYLLRIHDDFLTIMGTKNDLTNFHCIVNWETSELNMINTVATQINNPSDKALPIDIVGKFKDVFW